ncbi:hypothetical protein H6F74_05275 [Trichocoleus sp. FACHB-90]|uniref:hypothetical protein n=1 Tax=Cyanophyceae TaxID=3028117 RepID=UPI00168888AC|nr:hypothetical protein [Trichocoleus sp. FACHB-90]MBD1925696.1 hypothetical protein [Trichocoleus sp. FACHB-90]
MQIAGGAATFYKKRHCQVPSLRVEEDASICIIRYYRKTGQIPDVYGYSRSQSLTGNAILEAKPPFQSSRKLTYGALLNFYHSQSEIGNEKRRINPKS